MAHIATRDFFHWVANKYGGVRQVTLPLALEYVTEQRISSKDTNANCLGVGTFHLDTNVDNALSPAMYFSTRATSPKENCKKQWTWPAQKGKVGADCKYTTSPFVMVAPEDTLHEEAHMQLLPTNSKPLLWRAFIIFLVGFLTFPKKYPSLKHSICVSNEWMCSAITEASKEFS